MTARPGIIRTVIGGTINVVLMAFVAGLISDQYMAWAASLLAERVAWPQISFMSEYPKDVRNGYLLFVLAVFTTIALSSGLIAGTIGASPGKWIAGIRYHRIGGGPAGLCRSLQRALLYCATLAPALLIGPVLGFAFGEAADIFSLLALFAGCLLFIALTCWPASGSDGLSWLNYTSGIEPVAKSKRSI